jgi:molybdopterin synthase sulfur carrier subunit
VRITYSAWLGKKVGLEKEEVTLPPQVTNVELLIDWLSRRGPRFEEAFEFVEVIKVIVNGTYVHNDQPVKDNDEVIFIPPISGG